MLRFDKAFPVVVESELFGGARGVARNISPGGMMVELPEPVPLGSTVTVRFRIPDSAGDIEALAEVKHHYCFNFAAGAEPGRARGVGLRFVDWVADGAERWRESFTRGRVLH